MELNGNQHNMDEMRQSEEDFDSGDTSDVHNSELENTGDDESDS